MVRGGLLTMSVNDRPWLARTYFLLKPALRGPHARAAAAVRCPGAGGTVLDLCTGTGLLARRVSRRCPEARVLGVDFDRAMTAQARRLHCGPGLESLSFEVADVTSLPLGSESVDCVTCALGLHEMPAADVPRALAESFRVLRRGGQLLVLDFHPRPVRWPSRAALAVLRRVEEYMEGFSELDLTSEIRECGFEGVTDLMPLGGLYQLLDCTKP